MLARVEAWAAVNSGSRNLEGLARMAGLIADEFASLPGPLTLRDPAPVEAVPAAKGARTRLGMGTPAEGSAAVAEASSRQAEPGRSWVGEALSLRAGISLRAVSDLDLRDHAVHDEPGPPQRGWFTLESVLGDLRGLGPVAEGKEGLGRGPIEETTMKRIDRKCAGLSDEDYIKEIIAGRAPRVTRLEAAREPLP